MRLSSAVLVFAVGNNAKAPFLGIEAPAKCHFPAHAALILERNSSKEMAERVPVYIRHHISLIDESSGVVIEANTAPCRERAVLKDDVTTQYGKEGKLRIGGELMFDRRIDNDRVRITTIFKNKIDDSWRSLGRPNESGLPDSEPRAMARDEFITSKLDGFARQASLFVAGQP